MPQARTAWFREVLKKYDRVAVTGIPKTGKSTLTRWCEDRSCPVVHSDSLMNMEWSQASQTLADKVNAIKGKVLVEGVAVPRALRKGMRVDVVVWLEDPIVPLLKGQETMGKGVRKIFSEWRAANPDVPVLIAPPIAKDEDEEEETQGEAE